LIKQKQKTPKLKPTKEKMDNRKRIVWGTRELDESDFPILNKEHKKRQNAWESLVLKRMNELELFNVSEDDYEKQKGLFDREIDKQKKTMLKKQLTRIQNNLGLQKEYKRILDLTQRFLLNPLESLENHSEWNKQVLQMQKEWSRFAVSLLPNPVTGKTIEIIEEEIEQLKKNETDLQKMIDTPENGEEQKTKYKNALKTTRTQITKNKGYLELLRPIRDLQKPFALPDGGRNLKYTKLECQLCFKKVNLSHCGGCKKAVYCSVECQAQDYGRHKNQCK